jgi:hypothetical protein
MGAKSGHLRLIDAFSIARAAAYTVLIIKPLFARSNPDQELGSTSETPCCKKGCDFQLREGQKPFFRLNPFLRTRTNFYLFKFYSGFASSYLVCVHFIPYFSGYIANTPCKDLKWPLCLKYS